MKDDYKHWYGGFFGFGSDGQTKVEIAREIQNALRNGEKIPRLKILQLATATERGLKVIGHVAGNGGYR